MDRNLEMVKISKFSFIVTSAHRPALNATYASPHARLQRDATFKFTNLCLMKFMMKFVHNLFHSLWTRLLDFCPLEFKFSGRNFLGSKFQIFAFGVGAYGTVGD